MTVANCERCGTEFRKRKPGQRYCSRSCGTRGEKPGKAGSRKLSVELTCPVCGQTYMATRSDKRACSRTCYARLPDRQQQYQEYRSRPEYKARKSEWRRTPRQAERTRNYNRIHNLRKYGLTVEDYDRMFAEQGGVCILCGNAPNPDGVRAASRLHPDHDHVTGQVRDLLCLTCNVGIGHLRDDPALLRKAAEYIERHRALVAEGKS